MKTFAFPFVLAAVLSVACALAFAATT